MNVSIEHVTAGYGKKTVLFDISLTVDSGDVVCLLGANGSGKTTLFKTVLGLIRPFGGKVCVDGQTSPHGRVNALRKPSVMCHKRTLRHLHIVFATWC